MDNDKKEIRRFEHLGKVMNTDYYYPLTDEECDEIRAEYYSKPSFDEVRREILKIAQGGVNFGTIRRYYFKDLMAKVRLHDCKWSIEELLQSNELIRSTYARTIENKKVFSDDLSKCEKLEKIFQIGGSGIARNTSNFPFKSARETIKLMHNNRRYYDFSCGWGVRMMASITAGVAYFGTDPNHLLIERLEELKRDIAKVTRREVKAELFCQGSEVFIPKLEGTIGLAFSSPPYFGLEDYRVGDGQSFSEGMEYQAWVDDYLLPTMENNHRYLKDDGKLIVNINNYKNFDLVGSTIKACEEVGFKMEDGLLLQNIRRPTVNNVFKEGQEDMMIFSKK